MILWVESSRVMILCLNLPLEIMFHVFILYLQIGGLSSNVYSICCWEERIDALCTEAIKRQVSHPYTHALKLYKCIPVRWGHCLLLLTPAWSHCMMSTTECRLLWDLWAGHEACCPLVDYLFLFVLQGHKWIWGNQEICGHKVSACLPAVSMAALDDCLFCFSYEININTILPWMQF